MKLNTKLAGTCTDIIVTPECAPWSRASGKVVPKGFNDERAKLFEKAAATDQRRRNPQPNVLFENTEIHPGLPKDASRQEELRQGKFTVSDACDLGGMSSRPRTIQCHSNMAEASQLIQRKPAPSGYALEPGWTPVMHPMCCLLSQVDTWNPQECVQPNSLKQMLQGKLSMEQCRNTKAVDMALGTSI